MTEAASGCGKAYEKPGIAADMFHSGQKTCQTLVHIVAPSPSHRWANNGGRKWKGGRPPTASVNFITVRLCRDPSVPLALHDRALMARLPRCNLDWIRAM